MEALDLELAVMTQPTNLLIYKNVMSLVNRLTANDNDNYNTLNSV